MTIRPARLSELGERLRAEVRGDGSKTIVGLAALDVAGPEELSFLLHPRYRARAAASQAGALLVSKEEADRPEFAERALLVVEDPELARLELLSTLYPSRPGHAGVHPTASVAASAQVDPSAALGPYAVVGEGASLERMPCFAPTWWWGGTAGWERRWFFIPTWCSTTAPSLEHGR